MISIVRRLLALGALVVAVAALTAILVDDSPAIGSDDVARSLTGELDMGGPAVCRELTDWRWECEVPDGGPLYVVTATSDHCWEARLMASQGERAHQEAGGCVL